MWSMATTRPIIMAENPKPTEEEVVRAISGNVCRCTGYTKIIDSILYASKKGGEG